MSFFYQYGWSDTQDYHIKRVIGGLDWRSNAAMSRKPIDTRGVLFTSFGLISAKSPITKKIVMPQLNGMVGFTYSPMAGKLRGKKIWLLLRSEAVDDKPYVALYGHKGARIIAIDDRAKKKHRTLWTQMARIEDSGIKKYHELVEKTDKILQEAMVMINPDGSIEIKKIALDAPAPMVISIDSLG